MSDEYSTYEAKAKFSELLRKVRDGKTITICYHGKPVAEMRPLEQQRDSLEERLSRLQARGAIVGARNRAAEFKPVVRKPGALQRFLNERDE
jgi:prevent-host-death family protein